MTSVVSAFRKAMTPGDLPQGANDSTREAPAELRHIARTLGAPWDSTVAYLLPIFLSLMLLAWRPNRKPPPDGLDASLMELMDRACNGDAAELIEYARRSQTKADLLTWKWFAENAVGYPVLPLARMWPLVTRKRFERRREFNAACALLWLGNPLELHGIIEKREIDAEETQVLADLLTHFRFGRGEIDEESRKDAMVHLLSGNDVVGAFKSFWPFKRLDGQRNNTPLLAKDHGLLPHIKRKLETKQKWKIHLARLEAERTFKRTPVQSSHDQLGLSEIRQVRA